MSEQSLSEVRARLNDILAEAKNKYEDNVIKEVRDKVRNMRARLEEGDCLARKQSQAGRRGLHRHRRKHRELVAKGKVEDRISEEEEERRMEEEKKIHSDKRIG